MCKKLLFLLVTLAFCPLAVASDIAISTQAGWFGQGVADTEMQQVVDNVSLDDKVTSVQRFNAGQHSALATWVQDHTDNGTTDLLILCGQLPNTLYTPGNSQADGSLIELFIDGGNAVLNTGDYIFYVVDGAGTNGDAALRNIMDVAAAGMWGADGTNLPPTADGQLYTPSYTDATCPRPWFPAQFSGTDWELEMAFGQTTDGSQCDGFMRNKVTGGRIGIVYQIASDAPPRGEVIGEWINNYFKAFVAAGNPYARNPSPADKSEIMQQYYALGWKKGDFATSHDVYVGTDEAAVTNATKASPEFRKNQTGTYFLVGYAGAPYPAGLQPGTTYYWRVDEVNPAEPESPWKGKTWSFSLPAEKATLPSPADGMGLVDMAPTLTWKVGWNVIVQEVFFGTDYDTVANAGAGEGDGVGGVAEYVPTGPLQPGTTYYWRVDTMGTTGMHPGDVWSFTTESGKPGGLLGEYYSFPQAGQPANPWVTFHISRVDPEIDFNWYVDDTTPGVDSPDPSIPVNGFSVRWTGEITIPLADTYTFYGASDDGMRIYVNNVLVMNAWVDRGRTETFGDITLAAGVYPIEVHYYENGGGANVTLSWSSPHLAKAIVPEKALSPPVKASGPRPGNGATDVNRMTDLEWAKGQYAASHDVYLGTDPVAVANATKTSPEFKGNQPVGNEKYDPGTLSLAQTYYWRVDEVNTSNPDSPWVGHVWSFTVGDFLVVDDIEDYNNFAPDRVFETWLDGWGTTNNGAIIGYPEPDFDAGESFVETSIVHDGDQSMPFFYNNNMKSSWATMTLPSHLRDWTQEGVKALSLWYYGFPASQGSFVEGPAGTYNMTAAGYDIWATDIGELDEFHYAYKQLQGAGSMTAKVSAISGANLNAWAKAGIMIRQTLDPNSAHVFMATTNTEGVALQYRPEAAGTSVNHHNKADEDARPIWIRLDRAFDGTFTGYHANDVGGNPDKWTALNTTNLQMNSTVYIGLAFTSHTRYVSANVTFTNVTTTGTILGTTFTARDIGITSNAPEQMYVEIKDAQGRSASVYNTDLDAVNVTSWTEWGEYGQGIALQEFVDKTPALNLTNIDTISIGFGMPGNSQPGGSGMMFIDDIRLYKPRCVPTLAKPALDFNNDCLVSMPDLELMTDNWLISNWQVNPTAPSTSGLVANYQFQGNLLDSSGNANHGDPCGTTVGYAAGQVGQALNLDGTAYATAGNIGITGADPRTISGWAKASVPATSIADWTGVFGLSGASAGMAHFDIQAVGTTDSSTQDWYGIHVYGDEYNLAPIDLDWHHLAATYDGTTLKGYADGQQTASVALTLNTTGVMQIGQRGDNTNRFNGMVDEVRVYNRALSQDEIASLAGKTAAYTQDIGLLLTPQDANMDANTDGAIDFQDYAVLIDAWLDEILWP